eukprot:560493-Prymnesium_polylepis.1
MDRQGHRWFDWACTQTCPATISLSNGSELRACAVNGKFAASDAIPVPRRSAPRLRWSPGTVAKLRISSERSVRISAEL